MTKEDFIKKYPDVALQQLSSKVVLSRAEKEKIVEGMCKSLGTGLVYYESRGKKIKVFTSYRLKDELDKMVPGYEVTDPNTGQVGIVISEEPNLLGREMCVRVKFGNASDWYGVDYLIKEELHKYNPN